MHLGKTVFAQLMDFIPVHPFGRCVNRYQGNRKVSNFSCWDQFLCMTFAELTYRESLRDIETCLRAMGSHLYHVGLRGYVSRCTLADANETRDYRIYADLAQIRIATGPLPHGQQGPVSQNEMLAGLPTGKVQAPSCSRRNKIEIIQSNQMRNPVARGDSRDEKPMNLAQPVTRILLIIIHGHFRRPLETIATVAVSFAHRDGPGQAVSNQAPWK